MSDEIKTSPSDAVDTKRPELFLADGSRHIAGGHLPTAGQLLTGDKKASDRHLLGLQQQQIKKLTHTCNVLAGKLDAMKRSFGAFVQAYNDCDGDSKFNQEAVAKLVADFEEHLSVGSLHAALQEKK